MTAAVRERATVSADYAAFLLILDGIRPGAYFTVEDIRDALDPMQLSPNAVGAMFTHAYEDGHLIATDRIVNSKRASRRGGTARVWRKAAAA